MPWGGVFCCLLAVYCTSKSLRVGLRCRPTEQCKNRVTAMADICPLRRSGKVVVIVTILVTACGSPEPAPHGSTPDPDTRTWEPIFNGRDLDGWIPKFAGESVGNNYANTFRVENGILKTAYDKYADFDDRFGHLFFHRPYSHYIIAVEYRFVGRQAAGAPEWAFRNSGVMIHSQPPQTMGTDQDFPISIEVQLLGGTGTGERPTANLCTPGTHVEIEGRLVEEHCINSSSQTYHGDVWVRSETLVLADSLIRHIVGGDTVLEYSAPQIGGGVVNNFEPGAKPDGERLTNGYIALQSESHPIEFRKVELLNLKGCTDPSAVNYKSYYVERDDRECLYGSDVSD